MIHRCGLPLPECYLNWNSIGEALSQLSLAAGRYGYDGEVKDLLEEGLKMLRLQGPLEDLKTISHTPERYAELLHERAVSLKRYGVSGSL